MKNGRQITSGAPQADLISLGIKRKQRMTAWKKAIDDETTVKWDRGMGKLNWSSGVLLVNSLHM